MTDTTSNKVDASPSSNQQTDAERFFYHSPLKDPCFSITISSFKGDHALSSALRLSNDFPKGYIRLSEEKRGINALYFFNEDPFGLELLDMTEEQLTAYDEIVTKHDEARALSPTPLRAIHQLLGYIPEEKFYNKLSLKAHIQSLGLLDAPPKHIHSFKIKPLLKTNSALFTFLTAEQRIALRIDLLSAFHQLCTQYQAEETIHQRQNLSKYVEDIERCASLLRDLELVQKGKRLEAHKKQAQKTEEGLKKWYHEKIKQMNQFYLDFSAGKTVYLTRWMSELNVWRSYWGWAGRVIRTALEMAPKDFYNVQNTIDAIDTPQEPLRLLGCILYYVRFLINFSLVLKHTFKGPWMSEEEKQLIDQKGGTWNRFTECLAAEKFMLINDLVWMVNNLVNLLWLAKLSLGPLGDGIAAILLIGDEFLAFWAAVESLEKHKQEIQFYNEEIHNQQRIPDSASDDLNQDRKKVLEAQLERLIKARDLCEDHWQRQEKIRSADLYYAGGIALSFIPIVIRWAYIGAQATEAGLILGSTGLCFALGLLHSGYKAYLEVTKARDARLSALEECQNILLKEPPDIDARKANYIRYKDLFAQAEYQKELEKYQYYVFIRSVIIQSIIPIAIFAGFTFSTFGIGVAAFAVVAAVSILTHYALEYLKPKEAALAEFEEKAFTEFERVQENTSPKISAKNSIAADIEMLKSKGVVGLFSFQKENNTKSADIPDHGLPK